MPLITREEALVLLRHGGEGIARFNALWPYFDNPDLSDAILVKADARGADMCGVTLRRARCWRADFSETSLVDADLSEAHLDSANLQRAELVSADLSKADLRSADLSEADLFEANLSSASLSYASLYRTNLTGATLYGAVFDAAKLDQTCLVNVDLTALCQAKDLVLRGPCTIDYRSIIRSAHEPRLKEFLRANGMPEVFIEASVACAQALTPTQRRSVLLSTFISYGGPDETFAVKLNEALQVQGVTTFLFKKHAEPGVRLSRMMHEGIRKHDRVVLICSKASLERPGVLNEIQETLDREAADGGAEYLLPIRLDDHVFTEWAPTQPHLSAAIQSRVVADFRDPVEFQNDVAKLVRALTREPSNRI